MAGESRLFPTAAVASPHYLASAAGLAVLASGGNAVDAAVATNLTLGVVIPYLCGFGGDLFAIVWDGSVHGYAGGGRAPAAATREAVRAAAASDEMPRFGPLTVTVPGAVDGWFALLDRFGTRSFADLAQRALAYARDGFTPTNRGGEILRTSQKLYTADWSSGWREIYEDAGPGRVLRQPGLARTIEALCVDGPDAYYRGPIGRSIAQNVRAHGGLLDADDLASHVGAWVEPLATTWDGLEVLELPPPTQGVTALEALNIVGGLELGSGREHLLIEAAKLALADRDAYVTDPEHMTIDPRELASAAWADERRTSTDPARASAPGAGRAAVGGTAYMCAADADGMCVSLIQSNYVGFGSGVSVPEWGINLQNRGAFFSLDAGHANVIAPRKRTMHTLAPAMAMRNGRPWLVFGTMGGDGQTQTHLQLLTRIVLDGEDPQSAIDAPRWVVSPGDWSVTAESRFDDDVIERLRALGHRVAVTRPYDRQMGHAHAIRVDPAGYAAATDPRAEGAALGL